MDEWRAVTERIERLERWRSSAETMERAALDGAWTDYSAYSTVVGWSAFTTKRIYYKKVGTLVFVAFQLDGTSNSASSNFSLPYASSASGGPYIFAAQNSDNGGAYTWGLGTVSAGSSAVVCSKDANGAGFTASGAKNVRGQFWYEAA